MFGRNEAKIPHALRLAIFFLRVAAGISFFYVGYSTLFKTTLVPALRKQSLGGIYAWLGTTSIAWLHAAAPWLFLIIGICLTVGLATRLASLAGIILVATSWVSIIDLSRLNPIQFVNDELVILICLIVLFFGKAGTYLGLDMFFHFSLRHRKN